MTDAIRTVRRIARGMPASDGAGVKLTRVIGTPTLSDVDPFLMLDEFGSDTPGDYLAGFPDHPHRGFETVTYMLAGRMRHQDNQGNSGLLEAGSVQWMTAGRGIVHSEMPEQQSGLMRGFQLWVNLPARDKMMAPRYQDIAPERVPAVTPAPGVHARVLAGSLGGAVGPVGEVAVEPFYWDVSLEAGAELLAPVPAGHAAFVYVFEGALSVGPSDAAREVATSTLAVLGEGSRLRLAGAAGGGRAIVVGGRPLREPVARYGPFVMNTREELIAAFEDFQAGRFV